MRSQIRGLNKASDNAEDGISLIQTAEGALNEAHSILQRMNELAVQGANDTNETIDRDAINQELDQLTTELDRISTTTQFNKQNLLDGTFNDKNLQVGANSDQKISISIGNMNAQTLGLRSVSKTHDGWQQTGSTPKTVNYMGATYNYDNTSGYAFNVSAAKAQFAGDLSDLFTDSTLYVGNFDSDANKTVYTGHYNTAQFDTAVSAMSADIAALVSQMKIDITDNFADYVTTEESTGDKFNGYTETGRVAVDSYDIANKSITAIQNAINQVSNQRSALGAIQNRLEHTVANLDNISENTSSAESRIRDTDMAEEMVEYSKNNILAQAGQSMLAQSNQSTQGVLSLLQ
jgi:flagellin